ncbi:transketolase-like TK C-terminal-containing protein [Ruicaihuangia caeni]|uniref:Pyruvate dehydrogenase E1 component n=1 Tax=Ruicaihuangia caeni TaxID=3042517 RepID=A0AAW6T8Q7_9MICO|nr:pyruvate dehydrogenase [Klugiella sp. YN-L-19]MDI2099609.1 pyruvate dehydrogenase [Klugiella sp. YN-L-19]
MTANDELTSTLRCIERRVIWLATSIVHHANRRRPNPSGLKVGGHQASSASIATIMAALWFEHLRRGDRVSVKPHASPVMHAISYLLGQLEAPQLETLRQFGGLQSYPSRRKDPVPADFSTGSVGIGATAPIWAAIAKRQTERFTGSHARVRHYSLVGDAELDEGAVWEAVFDPMVRELGEVVWIVDINRQSLDRIVPQSAAERFERVFAAAGWQVLTVKFGKELEALFARPGGERLRERIIAMSNAEYQRMLRLPATELRAKLPGMGPHAEAIHALIDGLDDAALTSAIGNLGGHDFVALRRAFERIDDTVPTVILAYTVKGYLLPTAGHPQNHSALLTEEEYRQFAVEVGEDADSPWSRFDTSSAAGRLSAEVATRLHRTDPEAAATPFEPPVDFGHTPRGTAATQAALGRALLDLSRSAPELARRVVTVSPDVSSSTNLAGWINKVGVWAPAPRKDWFDGDGQTMLHWREAPEGQHIELGIAEVNLVSLLGELGATWSRDGQPLIPIGTIYDPFVERALEPWSYGIYAGGQSILVGTPSGVTLAPEGGAHQSIKTPSIGLEQPECVSVEPAFAIEVEWLLLDAISRLGRQDGTSTYLRLSTRPVDQALAELPTDAAGRAQRRKHVVAGGYVLRPAADPHVRIAAMGAMVPEALEAASMLLLSGIRAEVVVVTSADKLFRAAQARAGLDDAPSWIIEQLFPAAVPAPLVTVLDGHPHTLAFLGSVAKSEARHLGVSKFGQSGDLDSVYAWHGIGAADIAGAALDLVRL